MFKKKTKKTDKQINKATNQNKTQTNNNNKQKQCETEKQCNAINI